MVTKIKNFWSKKQRKIKDINLKSIAWIFSSFEIIIIIGILVFVFIHGASNLSFNMLISDYNITAINLKYEGDISPYEDKTIEGSFYSSTWGVALKDETNNAGENVVIISYIEPTSPFKYCIDQTSGDITSINENYCIRKVVLEDEEGNIYYGFSKNGAEKMANTLSKGTKITDLQVTTSGGGIRGSLITTFILIALTLLISLPLGIMGAIYLSEYAPKNKFTLVLRSMIDMSSGIPSIIFGLVGAAIFIPFCNTVFASSGYSIIAGSLTLSIMLLPLIIRTTEEALHTIPDSLRSASLSLGASKFQTIFKIIIPNALSGILTSTLLAIGRIIGESAALIYVMGTMIKDKIIVNQGSSSLAVHIYRIMQGENPNYSQACAISIIILIVVLILNILVKLISKKLNKFEVK